MSNNLKLAFSCIAQKYFRLQGRASRREFWLFTICVILLNFIPEVNYYIFKNNVSFLSKLLILIYSFFAIFLIIPSFTVTIRRLHDLNFNGWWLLFFNAPLSISIAVSDINKIFYYISVALFIIFIILLLFKGTTGSNHYGKPPVD